MQKLPQNNETLALLLAESWYVEILDPFRGRDNVLLPAVLGALNGSQGLQLYGAAFAHTHPAVRDLGLDPLEHRRGSPARAGPVLSGV